MASVPVRAATVILLRESAPPRLEVFLLKRSGQSSFMAGNFVYPGGQVDEGDGGEAVLAVCSCLTPDEAARVLALDSGTEALSYYVAAIRELFEEAGVLLANDDRGRPHPSAPDAFSRIRQWQLQLHSGETDMTRLAVTQGFTLALDGLRYFAHWITPEARPYRFDTRFFLALLPEGQKAEPDLHETTEGIWVSPLEALEANLEGSIALSPPTLKTLEDLLGFASAGEAFRRGGGRRPQTVIPEVKWIGGREHLLFPWDPEYTGPAPLSGSQEGPSRGVIPICNQRDTEAAARSRRRRTWQYVEESDEETTKVDRRVRIGIRQTTRLVLSEGRWLPPEK